MVYKAGALGQQLDMLKRKTGGALGVGIGFGMQAIVDNFVSGLILLFERPIKVGDVTQLSDGQQGQVANLGLRATTVQTFDRAEQFITTTVDVALLAQNVLLAAESLGLGGVYIGGIRNDLQTVCDLLAIPDQVYPVFGMCLGWPAHDPPPKPRLPVEAVLFTDRYPDAHDGIILEAYDRTTNHYYLNRNDNLMVRTDHAKPGRSGADSHQRAGQALGRSQRRDRLWCVLCAVVCRGGQTGLWRHDSSRLNGPSASWSTAARGGMRCRNALEFSGGHDHPQES